MTSLFRRSSSNGGSRGGAHLNNSRPNRQVRRLEFNQAMEDFRTMFPTMDYEVIECVLRSNNGAVDATIDQLLQMSLDGHGSDDSSDSDDSIPAEVRAREGEGREKGGREERERGEKDEREREREERRKGREREGQGGGGRERERERKGGGRKRGREREETGEREREREERKREREKGEEREEFGEGKDRKRGGGREVERGERGEGWGKREKRGKGERGGRERGERGKVKRQVRERKREMSGESGGLRGEKEGKARERRGGGRERGQRERERERRFTEMFINMHYSGADSGAGQFRRGAAPVYSPPAYDMHIYDRKYPEAPPTPPPRFEAQPPPGHQKVRSYKNWNPPLLGNLPDDFLRILPQQLDSIKSSQSSLSQPSSSSSSSVSSAGQWTAPPGSAPGTAASNGTAASEQDKKLKQYLEDERIALFLQNEEFMRELQRNREFLIALERDRLKFESKKSRSHASSVDSSGEHYSAEAVSDDALFRDKLKHMGKSTRKKLFEIARTFSEKTKRRKSKRRTLLKHHSLGTANSTANLLDDVDANPCAVANSQYLPKRALNQDEPRLRKRQNLVRSLNHDPSSRSVSGFMDWHHDSKQPKDLSESTPQSL
ncbi:hypothetical protein WMY93_028898 [Mugilogobius chulae]|uniref:CUE domain-containing protein n=1 Tax=Mugilogobius chulae TaxID=88201 RepID=A0AAW0MYR3_9GOBI